MEYVNKEEKNGLFKKAVESVRGLDPGHIKKIKFNDHDSTYTIMKDIQGKMYILANKPSDLEQFAKVSCSIAGYPAFEVK